MDIETADENEDVRTMRRNAAQIMLEGARERAATSLLLRGCQEIHKQFSPNHLDEYPSRPDVVRKKAFAKLVCHASPFCVTLSILDSAERQKKTGRMSYADVSMH
jgi:hypothetical protein